MMHKSYLILAAVIFLLFGCDKPKLVSPPDPVTTSGKSTKTLGRDSGDPATWILYLQGGPALRPLRPVTPHSLGELVIDRTAPEDHDGDA